MKLLVFLGILIFMSCKLGYAQVQCNVVEGNNFSLAVNPNNGSLISYKRNGTEYIYQGDTKENLFKLRLRDHSGKPIDLASLEAEKINITEEKSALKTVIKIQYTKLNHQPVDATVTIESLPNDPLTYWDIAIDNSTDFYIDNIDFPLVKVNSDLIGSGGRARIFRPWAEGVVIENLDIVNNTWFKPRPIEYPNAGCLGIYPGDCNMQFMAYYKNGSGLYFAAHDKESNMKGINFYPQSNPSILLNYRLFPGAPKHHYSLPYKMVLGGFDGDWYDAADIYRKWVESVDLLKMPKLIDNIRIPAWYEKSPIVVSYPVRGTRDMGDMTPNEYYPYTKALPVIDQLSKDFGSNILTLLMHWEGSAPWAPPYVWPPYGGTGNFSEFVDKLHQKGNMIGLYASGTGYTIKSNTDTTYNMTKEWNKKNIKGIVTIAPDGSLCTNGTCTGPHAQRIGHDMCPATPFVKKVVHDEVQKMLNNKIDYSQYFDQLMGGYCYSCYSKNHGHPEAPGKWMKDAMVDIYSDIQQMIDQSDKKILIGCEEAASEPFIPYLALNDSRYNLGYSHGNPVPAYAYLYHEYVNNFSGNQVCSSGLINNKKSPYNYLQRISQSFIAGDFMTVVLAGKGQIAWDWGSDWNDKLPGQQEVKTLIRNLNSWRQSGYKKYLIYGRMERPYELKGTYDIPMITPGNKEIHNSSLFTSRWKSQEGDVAQVIVNYTEKQQSCEIVCPDNENRLIKVLNSPSDKGKELKLSSVGKASLGVPPYAAIFIEFE
jgi:hypothetical protein